MRIDSVDGCRHLSDQVRKAQLVAVALTLKINVHSIEILCLDRTDERV
jgi:hypothetical protein